jgi:hypothetical protein
LVSSRSLLPTRNYVRNAGLPAARCVFLLRSITSEREIENFTKIFSSVGEPDPHPDPIRISRIRMFLGLRIRIRIRLSQVRILLRIRIQLRIRLRILLSSSKNSKKNLDLFYFVTAMTFYHCSGSASGSLGFEHPGSVFGSLVRGTVRI